jgi:YfiH family protein
MPATLVAGFSTALPALSDARLQALAPSLGALDGSAAVPAVILAQHHSTRLLDLGSLPPTDGRVDGRTRPALPPFDTGGTSTLAFDGAYAGPTVSALLLIKAADCVPVLAVDPQTGRYGALHAGWRGAAGGILPALLERWRREGSTLRLVRLAFGPHIQGCCYEVGADCLSAFEPEALEQAVIRDGRATHLALSAVLSQQAAALGIAPERVQTSTHCTRCHREADGRHRYASYRRTRQEGTGPVGRNLSLIGLVSARRT